MTTATTPKSSAGAEISSSQKTLWFLSKVDPIASAAYNVVAIVRFDGRLDVEALQQALMLEAERQEVLRAYFVAERGRPRMFLTEKHLGRIETLTLENMADSDQAASQAIAALALQPFDLGKPPLLRTLLATVGPELHYFGIIAHHTILDGWSLGLLFRELEVLYRAHAEGGEGHLKPLVRRFSELAAADREAERSPEFAASLEACSRRLAGAPMLLELPTDFPRPAIKSHQGARWSHLLEDASGRLERFARAHRVTPFAPLCTAFAVLLWRLTGQTDLLIGTPVTYRPTLDHERVLGPFINTVVLRPRIETSESFVALMQRIQRQLFETLNEAAVPFEKVVETLKPERRADIDPIIQVMFSYPSNLQEPASFAAGLTARSLDPGGSAAQLDLTLTASQDPGEPIQLAFVYGTALFKERTIELLAERLQNILESALAAPTTPLNELAWLCPQELALLSAWQGPHHPFPETATLPDLLASRAALTPDRIAFEAGSARISFAEWLERATHLAHFLRAQGAGPEVPIGVLLDRNLDLPVALLAIHLAGAAYLPLDPAFPPERLRQVLEDSGAPLVLSHPGYADSLGLTRLPHCRILEFESLDELAEAHTQGSGLSRAQPENIAYLLFTSGSTGKPKGVAISQRSLVHFLIAMAHSPGLAADDVLLAITTLSFDIAVLEFFLPLVCGAKVVLLDRESAADPKLLKGAIASSGATILQATPATFRMLLKSGWQAPSSLRMISGGEGLAGDLAEALLKNGAELWNAYGPTEATVWTNLRRVQLEDISLMGEKTVTLGRPIDNTAIHIVDRELRRQAIGVPGELMIGGAGLARGYWRRPGLTAERFVPDPFSERPGARLYRSGDLARWRVDGELEFLGRIDFQVKVRGFRIELGEIESVLSGHPGIADRVVVAAPGPGGEARLVAYVVAKDTAKPPLNQELREWIGSRLPPYMVPSVFVFLPALPLTPNLKVDRKALPPPSLQATLPPAAPRAEQNESERPVEAVSRPVEAISRPGTEVSRSQETLWFLAQVDPMASAAYNIMTVIRFDGPLDVDALQLALTLEAERQEVLRAYFVEERGRPRMFLTEKHLGRIETFTLENMADSDEAANQAIAALALQPFDLSKPPLLRTLLATAGPELHYFGIIVHHTILDGWSLGLMFDELEVLYRAHAEGGEGHLKPLVRRFSELAAADREAERSPEFAASLEACTRRLAGAPALLELPTDFPRPAIKSNLGARWRHLFEDPSGRLERFARAHRVTPFAPLCATFAVLLWRLTGQTDLLIGTPVAHRPTLDHEGVLGPFINTVVLRPRIETSESFVALMQRIQRQLFEALNEAAVPFEKVVETLNPERRQDVDPVFQVMFSFESNLQEPSSFAAGLTARNLEPGVRTAQLDLTLVAGQGAGDSIKLQFVYGTALFKERTIELLAERWQNIFESAVAAPTTPLNELAWLNPKELALLSAWQGRRHPFPDTATLPDLLASRAAFTPDRIAFEAGSARISFAEWLERATHLAHFLRAQGAGPEVPIGVLLDRNLDLPVALLAIHLAGAAYLPLDPAFPPERLRQVLEDSGAPLVLSHPGYADSLGLTRLPHCRILEFKSLDELAEAGTRDSNLSRALPGNIAYLLFTSGSTGRPKGVAISQRSLVHLLIAMAHSPSLAAEDVLLAITTLSFDIAAVEFFLPLVCGAKVVLLDREAATDPGQLRDTIVSAGVTFLQATPATFRMLLKNGWQAPSSLRMISAGEGLATDLAAALLKNGAELWNGYGPTEAAVYTNLRPVRPENISLMGEKIVTLGRPIDNTEIYIVDRDMRRQAIGVPGELLISGEGLARGYWRRPGLSAERFVPDPFSEVPGARLYRSGDLARWRVDGELEFLGRIDFQVKVRGFRIELGEIESVLSGHPGIADRVVVAAPGPGGETRLVAYVVAKDTARPPRDQELREWIGNLLPPYMVPSVFVFLPALPLTPNLKVDRKALPPPTLHVTLPSAVPQAQQNESERRVETLFRETLEIDSVDPDANFFALGGHSLLAVKLLARIREEIGVEMPLRVFLRMPTPRQVAAHLEPQLAPEPQPVPAAALVEPAPAATIAEPATPTATEGPLPYGLERLWLVSQLGGGASSSYNITGIYRLRGPVDPELLRLAFEQVIARHAVLRTAIVLEGGQPRQRILAGLGWEMPVLELHGGEKERRQTFLAHAQELSRQPFELSTPPLFRLLLGRGGAHESWLVFVFHHAVFDAQSAAILQRELDEIYTALAAGREPRLAPLPLQVIDVAIRQRARLAAGELDGELEFWRQKLAGAPPLLELPTDRPRPQSPSFAGAHYGWTLPKGIRSRLRELQQRAGTSSFAPLAAAFGVLLARLSGQKDLTLGTPFADRPPETTHLIGFFVQTAVLRLGVDPEASFLELTRAVHQTQLEGLDHHEIPFERLVEALATERSAAANPLFQAMFVLQNDSGPTTWFGLRSETVAPVLETAHFDLTLVVTEGPDEPYFGFDYATDLFDESSIRRWAGHLTSLLVGALSDPDLPLERLPVLTPGERQTLLRASQGPARHFELGRQVSTLFDLFAEQVLRTPAAAAVAGIDENGGYGQWSYAQLADKAELVAGALIARGLQPATRVALCFEGSLWAMAAVLGTLKAGCTYTPLDPETPENRLNQLLEMAEAPIVLAERRRRPGLQAGDERLLEIDRLMSHPGASAHRQLDPALPAYLIFTSGSTGQPKGVLISNAAAVNLTHAFIAAHGFRAGWRWLVVPPLYFDASVGDLFPAWASGGTVVFHPAPATLDAPTLERFCADQDIRVIDTAAALFKSWLEGWQALRRPRVLPELEALMVGGEAVGLDQVADWQKLQGGRARFFNHYGPTETTVCATVCKTRDGSEISGDSLPIGRPLANVSTYVVDSSGALQPTGVAGELLIGGAGVALYYVGSPKRTAEAFVPDPYSRVPGARLYRSGDLARWRADGQLEFLGRADRQVKLRGFRIELGEIEAQLRRHEAVAEALVTLREDQPGARRLVAYLRVFRPLAAGELKAFAASQLPPYMVPSAFVTLGAFPLTPNGKIDLRALPQPEESQTERRPPQSVAELRLAAIWKDLLGVEPNLDDDFFEVGGSSLLLMQVSLRARQELGHEVSLASLFEASRLESMARLFEADAPARQNPPKTLDLAAKVQLDPTLRPGARPTRPVGHRNSFVTGGTGFLGAYLIDELLRQERGQIYVLVRSEDQDDARRRLRRNLQQYHLWRDDAAFRLVPVLGQLDQPRFGLTAAAFAELAAAIDVIFHNAATVNFLAPYSRLEGANVLGTEETIRLACQDGARPLHFVSTLGVFLQERYQRVLVYENDDPAPDGLHQGYEQTKWVAEKLVEEARRRGLPASIYRPARVSGSSRDGAANTVDLFYSWLRGCHQLGSAPDISDPIDLYPVDVLAKAIVGLSRYGDGHPAFFGRSFHFYNQATVPFSELIRSLNRQGLGIELVPYPEWYRRLTLTLEKGEKNALEPFLGLFTPTEEEDRQPLFDQQITETLLRQLGLETPKGEQLLAVYGSFLLRSGFFEKDQRKA